MSTKTYPVALVNITDGTVSGHKAGCADLKRGQLRKHADDAWELTVATKADAWFSYNADFLAESGEDSAYEIQWAACAKHVPAGDQHALYVSAFSEETPAAQELMNNGTTREAAVAAEPTPIKESTVKSTTKKTAAKKTTAKPAAKRAAGTTEKVTLKYTVPKGYTLKYPHGGYDLLKKSDAKSTGPAWYVTCNAHGEMTTADSAKGGDALGRRDALPTWCSKHEGFKPAKKTSAARKSSTRKTTTARVTKKA